MKFRHSAALCSMACLAAVTGLAMPAAADITTLQSDFQSPPDDARMMVRWWWFGPAVTQQGILRELTAMKNGGIGGFEVEPTYPLAVDQTTNGVNTTNFKLVSPQHLAMLGYTATQAKALGLRMDITLGSGWPYGGPMFSTATTAQKGGEGAGKGTSWVYTPNAAQIASHSQTISSSYGGSLVAVAGINGTDATNATVLPISVSSSGTTITLPSNFTGGTIYYTGFIQDIMAVKRAAYGGDGAVIDHLSAPIVNKFIKEVAELEIKACGRNPPFSIFCDSLEVSGENWTANMLAEFQKRRGYDLTRHLPALAASVDYYTDIRYDWGRTVTDVFNDNFNTQFKTLANRYGTKFRIQGYGNPPAALYSYSFCDLPEGEGDSNSTPDWRTSFKASRYASSANHLMGQRLSSSETLTWSHGAPFRATPTDMKGQVDTHFLEGINQVDLHGWGYSPNNVYYPGGSFYVGASFTDKNPWYIAMPDVAAYIQRVSEMLREGTPANDIALYLNEPDVYATATVSGGFSSMNSSYTNQNVLLTTILDAGYNLDAVDDGMIAKLGSVDTNTGTLSFSNGNAKYKVVVINAPHRMPLATAQTLQAFVNAGGYLVLTGTTTLPWLIPGIDPTTGKPYDSTPLTTIMGQLASNPHVITGVSSSSGASFASAIAAALQPDFTTSGAAVPTAIGAIHRHTPNGEVYFVANSTISAQSFTATFRQSGMQAEIWDPLTGKISPAIGYQDNGDGTTSVPLSLATYGSTLVVFTNRTLAGPGPSPSLSDIDLSTTGSPTGWNINFTTSSDDGTTLSVSNSTLADWTTIPGLAHFSGVGSYTKTFTVSSPYDQYGLVLNFGTSTLNTVSGSNSMSGFYANIKPPVLDAAVVYIDGNRVGTAWCPPYSVNLGQLSAGTHTLRIDVGNTPINYCSGKSVAAGGTPFTFGSNTYNYFPNYDNTAINNKYGNRFSVPNVNYYNTALPSGLLGPITLHAVPLQ